MQGRGDEEAGRGLADTPIAAAIGLRRAQPRAQAQALVAVAGGVAGDLAGVLALCQH